MPRDRDALYDILEAIRRIASYTADMDREAFAEAPAIQDAVIRRFEIIGEASKRLSKEFRESHPDIPWDRMAGMRDRVIHGYDTVDLDVVWKTARADLPALESRIAQIKSALR